MQLPEHVTLCDQCGMAPTDDLTIPKWVFMEVGDCTCNDEPSISRRTPDQTADQWENLGKDTEDQPDEPIGHDYHRELHEYLVQKGEREE
jgi:hypothetical protein